MTAAALLEDAAATLAAAGVESAEWDAERLLGHVLGWDRAMLVANPERVVPAPDEERFRALLQRRAAREPLQYIVGRQAFWRHEFLVTPAVLIPRPETELLVETSLELLKGVERPIVVDVGTGSGCIALSIAAEREDAEVHATDISEPALEVARENARRLGLEGRVTFHRGDLLEPLSGLEVHLVVSNPPYVDRADRAGLAPEVRDHDPALALHPPEGVLEMYRRLAEGASHKLRPGGWLAVELGQGLAEPVGSLCRAAGLAPSPPHLDLARIPRTLTARRA
ncbi:MAG TPA: peptide chain release factor N(5)-glutamine methyltransferase [Vicinamibacteria bacterium]|jgi:release factor glutamine methyltransferase|nr:peptide chain release factor N(5)-glutamine methyltransferase [Vicinamibacteria bacterium]